MPESVYKRAQVTEIVNAVVQRVANTGVVDQNLSNDVCVLKDAIDKMREDLNGINTQGVQSSIPATTEELDAIVSTTENATNTIINACEVIQAYLQDKPLSETAIIDAELIKIVEACTFQDLTGQRVTKVLKALKNVYLHLNELTDIINKRFATLAPPLPASDKDKNLLNGPQLSGQGISQEEIDKLLNDLC